MTTGGEKKDWAALAIALGTRVTQERDRLGITKEALGERSGLASRYIWRVEAGMQNIQLGNIGKIATGLGLTLAELMAGIEQLVANPAERKPSRPRGVLKKAV
ncbi:helix-turn-helix domain-containing protein [Sphingomonas sp.]|uniref:helix-turn-helix domain-containing protein n=1 Tax=Sphingomonas sp. TaxID=28214 RepID=UPI002DD67B39|nr:helix-turn-helix transcriptional regulator [Sphingomonas sp.]